MAFGPALGLGVASLGEVMDLKLRNDLIDDRSALIAKLRSTAPEGVTLVAARFLEPGARALSKELDQAVYVAGLPRAALAALGVRGLDDLRAQIATRRRQGSLTCVRETKRGPKTVDVGSVLEEVSVGEGAEVLVDAGLRGDLLPIRFRVHLDPEGTAKPSEVLDLLVGAEVPARIVREGLLGPGGTDLMAGSGNPASHHGRSTQRRLIQRIGHCVSRFDLLKSWVRVGADRARSGVESVRPIGALRRVAEELRQRRMIVPEQMLSAALAHAPGVLAASVTARHGKIHIDARFGEGSNDGELAYALEFFGARFAPRGAKEIVFRVHPSGSARDTRVRDLTATVAGVIARGLWPMAIARSSEAVHGAIVDRETDDLVRVDLRSVPAVREAPQQGSHRYDARGAGAATHRSRRGRASTPYPHPRARRLLAKPTLFYDLRFLLIAPAPRPGDVDAVFRDSLLLLRGGPSEVGSPCDLRPSARSRGLGLGPDKTAACAE